MPLSIFLWTTVNCQALLPLPTGYSDHSFQLWGNQDLLFCWDFNSENPVTTRAVLASSEGFFRTTGFCGSNASPKFKMKLYNETWSAVWVYNVPDRSDRRSHCMFDSILHVVQGEVSLNVSFQSPVNVGAIDIFPHSSSLKFESPGGPLPASHGSGNPWSWDLGNRALGSTILPAFKDGTSRLLNLDPV